MSLHRACCCGGSDGCCNGNRRCDPLANADGTGVGVKFSVLVTVQMRAEYGDGGYIFDVGGSTSAPLQIERTISAVAEPIPGSDAACDAVYRFGTVQLIALVPNFGTAAPPEAPVAVGILPIGALPGARPSGPFEFVPEGAALRELVLRIDGAYIPATGAVVASIRLTLGDAGVPENERAEFAIVMGGIDADRQYAALVHQEFYPMISGGLAGDRPCAPKVRLDPSLGTTPLVQDFLDGTLTFRTSFFEAGVFGPGDCPEYDPISPTSPCVSGDCTALSSRAGVYCFAASIQQGGDINGSGFDGEVSLIDDAVPCSAPAVARAFPLISGTARRPSFSFATPTTFLSGATTTLSFGNDGGDPPVAGAEERYLPCSYSGVEVQTNVSGFHTSTAIVSCGVIGIVGSGSGAEVEA